jgi:hypothetical protein
MLQGPKGGRYEEFLRCPSVSVITSMRSRGLHRLNLIRAFKKIHIKSCWGYPPGQTIINTVFPHMQ